MFKRNSLLIGMALLAGFAAQTAQGVCKNGVCRIAKSNTAKQRPVAKPQLRANQCKNGVCRMAVKKAVLRKQAVRKAVLRKGCKNGVCRVAVKNKPVVKQQPKAVKKAALKAKVAGKRRAVKQQPKKVKKALRKRR